MWEKENITRKGAEKTGQLCFSNKTFTLQM